MKEKILKIILVITCLPYIGIIVWGIVNMFLGVDTGLMPGSGTYVYGIEAFVSTILWGIVLGIILGILPICLVYQIFYLIRHFIKKKKLKEKEVDS